MDGLTQWLVDWFREQGVAVSTDEHDKTRRLIECAEVAEPPDAEYVVPVDLDGLASDLRMWITAGLL